MPSSNEQGSYAPYYALQYTSGCNNPVVLLPYVRDEATFAIWRNGTTCQVSNSRRWFLGHGITTTFEQLHTMLHIPATFMPFSLATAFPPHPRQGAKHLRQLAHKPPAPTPSTWQPLASGLWCNSWSKCSTQQVHHSSSHGEGPPAGWIAPPSTINSELRCGQL